VSTSWLLFGLALWAILIAFLFGPWITLALLSWIFGWGWWPHAVGATWAASALLFFYLYGRVMR
jgi:hypothetical protein